MKVAIYARKSRSTDQGESIQNQIDMCKSYATLNFTDIEFVIYKDDGFSGGNVDRPQFQLLLKELKKGAYDVLMCYRLDRISRNVSDFSSTLDLLTKNEIGFVSIKENFDTTTPMGRAMIHISSVFAQLERETIAERVRDNMYALARTGRWLGGVPPTGFTGKKKAYQDESGKKKYLTKLSPLPEEQELVKLIFHKYLELGSLSKVETYCMQQGIKTKNDKHFQPQTLSMILQNPVYCVADEGLYDYLENLGASMEQSKDKFDGSYGVMPYNRHKEGKQYKRNPYSEWIVAIGEHKGIVESKIWIKAQSRVEANRDKAIRSESPTEALLSGLLYCQDCGAKLLVVNQSKLADGTASFSYKCRTKHVSKGTKCQIKNVSGHRLDGYVVTQIKDMIHNKTELVDLLKKEKSNILSQQKILTNNKDRLEKDFNKNEKSIQTLIMKFVDSNDDPTIDDYVKKHVKILHAENEKIKDELLKIEKDSTTTEFQELNWDIIEDSLLNFSNLIDRQDVLGKRRLLKDIIRKIEWDGEKAHIHMYLDKLDGD